MIKIHRESGYGDILRSYKIMLDNACIGDIKDGETKGFNVTPGQHTIYLKIDWCQSNKIDFYINENQTIDFECGTSIRGAKFLMAIAYITFLKNSYLWIKVN